MTREAAIELIERIPYVITINALSSRMRLDFCKKAAQSKDPLIWIKAIKSAYIQKDHNSKAYSDIESEYTERTKKLLHKELAQALQIPEEEVEDFIKKHIESIK